MTWTQVDVEWTWGGGGAVPNYKFVRNKSEYKFPTLKSSTLDRVNVWGPA